MTPSGVGDGAAEGSAPDPVPATVDEIVAALRDDPILVSEMMGNGATQEVRDALHVKLEAAQVPVYVVLTRTPIGLDGGAADEELTALVHAELGDGIYLVHTSLGYGELTTYGDVDPTVDNDDTLVSLARYTAMDQVTAKVESTYGDDASVAPVAEAGVILDIAASATIPDYGESVLSEAQVAQYADLAWTSTGYRYDDGEDVEPVSVGLGALTAVSVGLVVAAVAFRLLRAALAGDAPRRASPVAERRERAKPAPAPTKAAPPPDPRDDAQAALDTLNHDLESRAAGRATPERLRMAIETRDLARDLLTPDPADPLDVVGALVLARTASQAIREPGAAPYRCCFVNPTHGAGRYQADLPGGLAVSVCRPCERALESGQEPSDALSETRRGRDRPYYAGDTVWARTGFGTLTDELWLDVQRDRGLR